MLKNFIISLTVFLITFLTQSQAWANVSSQTNDYSVKLGNSSFMELSTPNISYALKASDEVTQNNYIVWQMNFLLPGFTQFYTGNNIKGFLFILGIGLSAILFITGIGTGFNGMFNFFGGAILFLIFYTWSIIDAYIISNGRKQDKVLSYEINNTEEKLKLLNRLASKVNLKNGIVSLQILSF